MKEKLYTIPLKEAFEAHDECAFCYIKRQLEQHAMDFTLGASAASYMEEDVRENTDNLGFCAYHFEKMYAYGNRLGCGLILSTHMKKQNQKLAQEIKNFTPSKSSMLRRLKKSTSKETGSTTNIGQWIDQFSCQCTICDYEKTTFPRYIDTFFELYRKDADFVEQIKNSKGFCLPHFKDLVETGETLLSDSEKSVFYPIIFSLMTENMNRVENDITWFCDKFDYRHKDEDWKDSKDAIQRTMQKLAGGYPADNPYKD